MRRGQKAQHVTALEKITQALSEIEARERAATEGPWDFIDGRQDGPSDSVVWTKSGFAGYDENDEPHNTIATMPNDSYGYAMNMGKNGPFIAHSRTDIPKLRRAVEVLLEYVDDFSVGCAPGKISKIEEIASILGGDGK